MYTPEKLHMSFCRLHKFAGRLHSEYIFAQQSQRPAAKSVAEVPTVSQTCVSVGLPTVSQGSAEPEPR